MSFEVTEQELVELARDGKVRLKPSAPVAKETPKGPSDAERIISAINRLSSTLQNQKTPDAPEVNVAAPRVTVQAPTISFPPSPTIWVVEVVERDRDDRIKRLMFTAK